MEPVSYFLNYFSYSKFLLICFFQLFFIKYSNNLSTIKIVINICSWDCISNFTNYKNFFRPAWSISFSKNVFLIWFFYMIIKLKFRVFIIRINVVFNIIARLNINRFHFNCSMVYIAVSIHYIYQYIQFLILKFYICKFYSLKS